MQERTVQEAIVRHLKTKTEYSVIVKQCFGNQRGCDIEARHRRYRRLFLIECKGVNSPNYRDAAFINGLGRIVTRMAQGAASPHRYGLGLPRDAAETALRRIPWRLARALNLYVFSVTPAARVKLHSWRKMRAVQDAAAG